MNKNLFLFHVLCLTLNCIINEKIHMNCLIQIFLIKFSLICDHLFVLTAKEQGKPITVVYVPSHLYHMMFELFKVRFAFWFRLCVYTNAEFISITQHHTTCIFFIYPPLLLIYIYPFFVLYLATSNKGTFIYKWFWKSLFCLFFLENAMRATMELYGDAIEYPLIHAQVALGTEDLTVKVRLCCCISACFSTKIATTIKIPFCFLG